MRWLACIGILYFIQSSIAADLLVQLPYGTIQGRTLTSPGNRQFRAFQGIPYAAAPVNSLRFLAPQPPLKWNGVRNTTKDGNTCFSIKNDSPEENEDCLFINVYTPVLTNTNTKNLPVMVWMYGGAFRTGSSKYNNFGPDYLIEKDVVVVSLNYRIGPFGFLATEDDVIPGNAGLKDQAFAIKWVHDYIALFGGNPNRVIIFGQSAGGASVGYQLLYNQNKGMIHGAILQSGSPLSSFSFMGETSARAYAIELASKIDGAEDFKNNTKLLVDFLLKASARQIDKASTLTTIERPLPVIEKNVVGAFLTSESYELLQSGNFIRIPVIVGTTSEEDIFSVNDVNTYRTKFEAYDKNHNKFIPSKGFRLKQGVNKQTVGEEIYTLYFNNVAADERLGHFVKYNSDNKYSKSMIKHAELSAPFTDVYFYIFSHHGPMGNWNTSVRGADLVGHGEDDRYIWKIESSSFSNEDLGKFPQSDRLVHERVITLWTDFAKYLNPTHQRSEVLQNLTWPKVEKNRFQYLDIGDNLVIRQDPKSPYYAGWSSIYEKYNTRPFTIF